MEKSHVSSSQAERSESEIGLIREATDTAVEPEVLRERFLKSLDNIKKEDLAEIKAMNNPPKAVQKIFEHVCELLDKDKKWKNVKHTLE